ncbi:Fpg/Nei family DNA glycosylase [Cellulomonas hominis]|uniref:DNA-(apurinic or apyrimidinic site) lyase n=1 Tax=Cellulomonas hominis TaxID=156981 RepID=A0A7Z8NNV0_9CELL|nr:DNA glycosylase [Cellulomonas hominis]TKR22925.1 Fpg/Nei family DNA glycosylase [Cellulomonas hominis]
MPEGHTVHRIARQFARDFVGHRVAVSSPQGRFAQGAALLDGRELLTSAAVGKQLFLGFAGGHVLRVHLGLYGAWDFLGVVSPLVEGGGAVASLGAPRVRRSVRMGEGEREGDEGTELEDFPPEPVGQVRVRLATEQTVADLRGPTACEVLDPAATAAALARLGPDPAVEDDVRARMADPHAVAAATGAAHHEPGEADGSVADAVAPGPGTAADVMVQRLTARGTAVGQLLMDQAVVAGIGNIYRAELLYRARLDPHTPGKRVPTETARALWDDWSVLLADGIATGVMLTREDLDDAGRAAALRDPAQRHWVYGRAGEPCRTCGTPVVVEEMAGRKLYWCPTCQR